jgi:histone H3/H4
LVNREFSLYDIEQFLREAGAEKVNERAVLSLEKELEDTVKELLAEASVYANYAGRKRLIKRSDIVLLNRNGPRAMRTRARGYPQHKSVHKQNQHGRALIEEMVRAQLPRAAQEASL